MALFRSTARGPGNGWCPLADKVPERSGRFAGRALPSAAPHLAVRYTPRPWTQRGPLQRPAASTRSGPHFATSVGLLSIMHGFEGSRPAKTIIRHWAKPGLPELKAIPDFLSDPASRRQNRLSSVLGDLRPFGYN